MSISSKGGFGDRQGALLRIVFEDGKLGYADCHPWVGLGDPPLDMQLSLLSRGLLTNVTKRSLHFAKIDAEARSKRIYLFSETVIPPSHWLISHPEQDIPDQFSRVKWKVGSDPLNEIPALLHLLKRLPSHVKVRLDFNGKLLQRDFKEYIESVGAWKHRIDFIEDPFPYDSQSWETIQKCYGVTLACDHQSEKRCRKVNSHSVTVVKPAIQDEQIFFHGINDEQRIVVTSYLDHPLGQLNAAYIAAMFLSKFPAKVDACGLLTHTVYQTNEFSETLQIQGTVLAPPKEGTGFGFDDLLEKQNWRILV